MQLTKDTLTIPFRRWVFETPGQPLLPTLTFDIRTRPALFFRGLSVHFEVCGHLPSVYVISHIFSGMAIARFSERSNAMTALRLLGGLADWPNIEPQACSEYLEDRVNQVLAPLKEVDPYYTDIAAGHL